MFRSFCTASALTFLLVAAKAEGALEIEPLTPEQIAARGAKPLTQDDVKKMVSGAKMQWSASAGGERLWTNEPSGHFWGTRIGTGVGSFNPHHKASRGTWEVRADGTYCVHLDHGHMMVEDYCLQFYDVDSHVLMSIEPPSPGSTIRISH